MKRLLLFLAALVLASCDDPVNARRTLEDSGYSSIELTGGQVFGCSKDDGTATGFRAKNPVGRKVEGVVCCGFVFKSCTVRF
jgi:hypothetical protein